jgi:hypothetical protein
VGLRDHFDRPVRIERLDAIRLHPDDVIIAKLPDDPGITQAEIEDIYEGLQQELPNHKVLVVIGMDIHVARPLT